MILAKFAQMRALFLDVDGVLTDGAVLVTEEGEQLRRFSIKDGYALQYAIKQGLIIVVISGAQSKGVLARLKGLGITEIYLGVADKLGLMEDIMQRFSLKSNEVVFIGDDIPDLLCMKQAGIGVCPSDAVEEVKKIADYISPKKGGEGCVREVIEMILKLTDRWTSDSTIKSV